jgi:hypothetical protein
VNNRARLLQREFRRAILRSRQQCRNDERVVVGTTPEPQSPAAPGAGPNRSWTPSAPRNRSVTAAPPTRANEPRGPRRGVHSVCDPALDSSNPGSPAHPAPGAGLALDQLSRRPGQSSGLGERSQRANGPDSATFHGRLAFMRVGTCIRLGKAPYSDASTYTHVGICRNAS